MKIVRPKLRTRTSAVEVQVGEITIPTYLPAAPDKNPMFLENRVYQGSSGRVYPLPFTDRIQEKPVDHTWKAIWIENEFLRALILPEIGGRIHALEDKTNGYDLIYRQSVIKPALVGLAGPWISGGIEFNWPQHHRPATFLPVDVQIESCPNGSKIVWCSDHDPLTRMKGMHGVCLHPGKAYLELKVRVFNRTLLTQTFLWWANVGTRVHEAYQSFFPGDVYYVADHARRSTSAYPLCQGRYYGVPYGHRALKGVPKSELPSKYIPPHCGGSGPVHYPANDLSFYANIPVPTSYMCMESKEDFFGGYDHHAHAGILHFANHYIAPGKKQWTWGNHEFGYAWDRNLTDADAQGEYAPYIELMAGVYTDNQPDFSFLQPGETKSWSQYWYPLREIGPVQNANLDAALSIARRKGKVRIGLGVTGHRPGTVVLIALKGKELHRFKRDLSPARPLVEEVPFPRRILLSNLEIRALSPDGHEIIRYQPTVKPHRKMPAPASEPPDPVQVSNGDLLYLVGVHLEQYRHATRSPVPYWREALRRDPLDARCNNAMGLYHLRRGEFREAEEFFQRSIQRLTQYNANPYDGEPFYNLGLCLRYLGRDDDAYAAFYKAVWNRAWAGPGYLALAEIDGSRRCWTEALAHLDLSLTHDSVNLRARNLKVIALRRSGELAAAKLLLEQTLEMDSLDWWARHLQGEVLQCNLQTMLDVAHDYARAGLLYEAVELLSNPKIQESKLPDQSWGAQPLLSYTLGWLEDRRGNAAAARRHFRHARSLRTDYCFPARLEEIQILETALRYYPKDAQAAYYFGNLLYDRRRHDEAIRNWERSTRFNPRFSITWRNLGIAYFNVRKQPGKARRAYDKAFQNNPSDARLLYERDQLWKRLGEKPGVRLRELTPHLDLIQNRDDLCVELCALYNQTGQHQKAADLLSSRQFQPWEGGEGGPLGQHVRTQLALGQLALTSNDFESAQRHFQNALAPPKNLGEAKHLLANQSDIYYWLGCACSAQEESKSARSYWRSAATFRGDFQNMSVRSFSEMTYYSARSMEKLGLAAKAKGMMRELLLYARNLEKAPAKIDYFATSLPTMLLFNDDLPFRQVTTSLFLQAQAYLGLGNKMKARRLFRAVLRRDPSHALASDFAKGIGV